VWDCHRQPTLYLHKLLVKWKRDHLLSFPSRNNGDDYLICINIILSTYTGDIREAACKEKNFESASSAALKVIGPHKWILNRLEERTLSRVCVFESDTKNN
jgi:hypothetical protein